MRIIYYNGSVFGIRIPSVSSFNVTEIRSDRDMGDTWRLDIHNLLFEPSPKLSPKLWVVAARFANSRPGDEILRRTT